MGKVRGLGLFLQPMSKIDPVNDKILRALSQDGRISNLQLAEQVGLSPSACLRRVQELERSGVIKGYRARLDPLQTGRAYVVYVAVGLAEHTKAAQTGFEQAMMRAGEVAECHNVAGAFDCHVTIRDSYLAGSSGGVSGTALCVATWDDSTFYTNTCP